MVDEQERCRRVRILLSTLFDYLPTINHVSSTPTGFAHGDRTLRCPDCDFNGFKHRNCETCGGSGHTIECDTDPYDTGHDFSWMNLEDEKRRSARRRDQLILQLRRDELAREGKLDLRERYGWETKRMMMERSGDYRKLRLSLIDLKKASPTLYQLIHRLYFSGLWIDPQTTGHEQVAVLFLSRQIKGPIRVPDWFDTARRELTFADLVAQGFSSKQIALRMNMTQRKVKRLLKENHALPR